MAKQLQEVQVERDELAIAERVSNRLAEQVRADAGAVAPASAKVAGRAVLLIPHRSDAAADNRPNYSGKHKCHGLLVIALTDDRGRLVWITAVRPARTSEITACRHNKLTARLRAPGQPGSAPSRPRGSSASTTVPLTPTRPDLPEFPDSYAHQAV